MATASQTDPLDKCASRLTDSRSIEALIADGGNITFGAVYLSECAVTAADAHNSVAMLVRREGETLNALLKRLDKTLAHFYDYGEAIDEVNGS